MYIFRCGNLVSNQLARRKKIGGSSANLFGRRRRRKWKRRRRMMQRCSDWLVGWLVGWWPVADHTCEGLYCAADLFGGE